MIGQINFGALFILTECDSIARWFHGVHKCVYCVKREFILFFFCIVLYFIQPNVLRCAAWFNVHQSTNDKLLQTYVIEKMSEWAVENRMGKIQISTQKENVPTGTCTPLTIERCLPNFDFFFQWHPGKNRNSHTKINKLAVETAIYGLICTILFCSRIYFVYFGLCSNLFRILELILFHNEYHTESSACLMEIHDFSRLNSDFTSVKTS